MRHRRTHRTLDSATPRSAAAVAAAARDGAAGQHLRAQAGGAESVLPRRRADRRDGRSGGLGQELPAAVRRLSADGRSGAHALRRQRGGAAHADAGRSAVDRGAVAARGGPAAEDACGPATRSRTTSARSAATPTCSTTRRSPSASRSRKQPGTCMHCHASVYVPYKKLGGGDLIKGFEEHEPDAVRRSAQAGHASGGLHRLPRPEDDAAARDAAGRSSKASAL